MKKLLLPTLITLSCIAMISCESVARFPIDEKPLANAADDHIVGKWKIEEDTNTANFYVVTKNYGRGMYNYHIAFWNRGGKNKTYETNIFCSRVGDAYFVNIPHPNEDSDKMGYFFLKIIDSNPSFDRVTTATFFDTSLHSLAGSKAVRAHIESHVNDPAYYHDTVHLYKVR